MNKEEIINLCDMHTHSNCSDGTFSPKELIKIAVKENLKAIALCDHNTTSGLKKFTEEAKKHNIIAVPGVEVTSEYNGKEVHVLGLFIKEEKHSEIEKYLEIINIRKEENNKELAKTLKEAGYEIDYEEIKNKFKCAHPNRMHFAKTLLEKGYITSTKEAFDTILKDGGEFYKSAKKLDTIEVIKFLSSQETVPVIAHPLLNLTKEELDKLIIDAKPHGLIAIEGIYPLYSEEDTKNADILIKKHNILKSGGSDYHGLNKPDIKIGLGKNNIKVPFEIYQNLKNASKTI